MNFRLPLLACAALAFSAAALSADSFEGKITMKVTPSKGQSQQIEYTIKGSKLMFGVPNKGSVIFDQETKEMTVLMPQQHMYMVQAMPTPGAPPAGAGGYGGYGGYVPSSAQAADGKGSFEVTSNHQTICGYPCTEYIATGANGDRADLWVTDQLGNFFAMGMGGGRPGMGGMGAQSTPSWAQSLLGKGFFPLKVTAQEKNGTTTLEVTSVSKSSVDDSVFQPPAGWKKFDLAAMMGGMGGGYAPH